MHFLKYWILIALRKFYETSVKVKFCTYILKDKSEKDHYSTGTLQGDSSFSTSNVWVSSEVFATGFYSENKPRSVLTIEPLKCFIPFRFTKIIWSTLNISVSLTLNKKTMKPCFQAINFCSFLFFRTIKWKRNSGRYSLFKTFNFQKLPYLWRNWRTSTAIHQKIPFRKLSEFFLHFPSFLNNKRKWKRNTGR